MSFRLLGASDPFPPQSSQKPQSSLCPQVGIPGLAHPSLSPCFRQHVSSYPCMTCFIKSNFRKQHPGSKRIHTSLHHILVTSQYPYGVPSALQRVTQHTGALLPASWTGSSPSGPLCSCTGFSSSAWKEAEIALQVIYSGSQWDARSSKYPQIQKNLWTSVNSPSFPQEEDSCL